MTSRHGYFFHYDPSVAGVVIASIVFGIITAFHIYFFVKTYKTMRIKIMVVLSMASFNEVLGYALRIPGSNSKPTGGLASLSPLLLLFTPLMVTSVIYYVFSKIATNIAAHNLPIKPTLMLKIWSVGDIICQLTISAGAMIASRSKPSSGKGILLAGLAIHFVILSVFMVIVVTWHRRVLQNSATQLAISTGRDISAIYITCTLILLRTLLRSVEFATGPNGALQKHEAPFYFYESLPITLAFVACLQWYHIETLKASL
ncbi:hypothetical protein T440DRAFT_543830 [Plenodomus tracheiphilus IPT5]|uniref:RTA1 like protein n=1 Tax=Plenodomus tracheiphilus IPT5 TaxID=1408161 RepID=A0A6A7AQV9_9PLEO|nr:hypothetical protein T440DRAFT_543830 [Plenodomus tracheiphilus IPT5]